MTIVGDLDQAVMKYLRLWDMLQERLEVASGLNTRTKLKRPSKHNMRNAIMKLAIPHRSKVALARQLHTCAHSET